jgi:hypothetical protein
MPTNLLTVGDAFNMTVDASLSPGFFPALKQTVVLARGSDLVVFAASLDKFFSAPLPSLSGWGITLTDLGAQCETPGFGCLLRPHSLKVTVATEDVVLSGGQSQPVGWLSFTNGTFNENADTGSCDSPFRTRLAGFRSPTKM